MEFDLPLWLLLALPLAFAAGWVAARFDLRQWRDASRRGPNAYFRGLNHLLNGEQDKAIDAFIEAVQSDPDTTELHFALGKLFRHRAEYLRAGRVHQHLLARADISQADRERAQYALAQDYLKAGTIDLAEQALQQLQSTRFAGEADIALLRLYERLNEWHEASTVIARIQQGDFSVRQAHYLCERAEKHLHAAEYTEARALLIQAIACASHAARPRLALAQLDHNEGQANTALESLLELARATPTALPLAAPLLVTTAQVTGRESEILPLLLRHYQQTLSLDLLDALVALQGKAHAQQNYLQHLQQKPSLVALTRWLAHGNWHPPAEVQHTLEQATQPLMRYRCTVCGFQSHDYLWRCFGCQTWDSYPIKRMDEL